MDKQKPKQRAHTGVESTQHWMHFCALPAVQMVLLANDYATVTQESKQLPVVRTTSRRRTSRHVKSQGQRRRLIRMPVRPVRR